MRSDEVNSTTRRQRGSAVPIHTDKSPEVHVLDLSVRIHTDNNTNHPNPSFYQVELENYGINVTPEKTRQVP